MVNNEIVLHQACYPPFESVEKIDEFLEKIKPCISWKQVGLLTDEGCRNQVFLLIDDEIKVSFRLNLSQNQLVSVITGLINNQSIELRNMQGQNFDEENLSTLDNLTDIWESCTPQSSLISINEFSGLLERLEEERFIKGRGKDFSKATRDQVRFDSHGYCMFQGCGERLELDYLTGESGNYGYKAHIVASSEMGPRGIPYLSEQLSDEPNNVMLLCDKHHRLIDKVALANFSASRLSQMRSDFMETATKLLSGLSYQPLPVYSILWPIGGYSLSPPQEREISSCLSQLQARIRGDRQDITHNENFFLNKPERFVRDMHEIVEDSAREVLNSVKKYDYKAVLFAFGPMPALVGLGALLGNKNEITPMLRYRDGNCWMWPQERPVSKPYDIDFGVFDDQSEDVVLSIAITNYPDKMREMEKQLNFPVIKVLAKSMGNGAIPHPGNGHELKIDLHQSLLTLKEKYAVKRVHLLICASNAVCVFVGQSYDLYHPNLIVYDFADQQMQPRLEISTKEGNVSVKNFSGHTSK